jgi:plasmid segregation protein ParM
MKTNPSIVGARAVDVGYFNVKHTLAPSPASAGRAGVAVFPAVAPVLKSGVARGIDGMAQPDGCVVPIGGVTYFVGPGAAQRGSGTEARIVGEDYSASDKYLALLRGALHYMAEDAQAQDQLVIQRLALGLPLNTYFDAWEQLSARALGEHVIGDGQARRTITVEKARVIVQPQGAMINFGYRNGGKPLGGLTLVADAGGGTLDWYLSEGTVPYWERSGAYPKAMLVCAWAVAYRINPRWRNQSAIVGRIDKAIREEDEAFVVQGVPYRLADFRPAVEQVLDEALDQMVSAVGSLNDIDHILFTGGGASVFKSHFHTRYPVLTKITRMDDDPVFSNVRGFQVVAENDLAAASGW